jgi:hypothetical protein
VYLFAKVFSNNENNLSDKVISLDFLGIWKFGNKDNDLINREKSHPLNIYTF